MTIGRELPYRRRGPAGARTGSLILDRHLAEKLDERQETERARKELRAERGKMPQPH